MKISYGSSNIFRKIAAASVMAGIVATASPHVFSATAAGTEIKNFATVSYEDAAGNVYTAQSNEAVVTVAQIYSASLGTDLDVNAAPGQEVYLPYVLENTGNGSDSFEFTAVNGIVGDDSLDSDQIRVYHDVNGNGEPDVGEPEISNLLLDADTLMNVVVSVQVPAGASAGQALGVTLTIQAREGGNSPVVGSVSDLSNGKGRDGLDDTNESLISISDDAILEILKSSSHDVLNNTITYTISVTNSGNAAAQDVVIFSGLPANTNFVASSVSGLSIGQSDVLDTFGTLDEPSNNFDINSDGDTTDSLESDLGWDLNTDGDFSDAAVEGIFAVDADLAPDDSVTLVFTVSYNQDALGGGYVINSVGHALGDLDGDGNRDVPVASNLVFDIVSQNFAVSLSDTGLGGAAGVNNGGDDDSGKNGDQTVDSVTSGALVEFDLVVINGGNGPDIFELDFNQGNFPEGTVFTFWDQTGTVLLNDTNNIGAVDTGVVASGASYSIKLKAALPAGVTGDDNGSEFQASVSATSAGDPSGLPVFDGVFVSLIEIIDASADLHTQANGLAGSNEDKLGSPDYTSVASFTSTAGSSINLPIFIDNESGIADTFALSSGGSWDGSVLGANHAGWAVEFFAINDAGNPTGTAITSTPVLPGNTLNYPLMAVVTIPVDAAQAIADVSTDNDVDGTDESLDGNADGDGDYPIFMRIVSANSGTSDLVLQTVDVSAGRSLALTPTHSNQIQTGSTVTFTNVLANNGNSVEVVEVISTHSLAGWTHTILVDTDGDGTPDTELGNLTPSSITVQQSNGVDVVVVVTDSDGDGNPEFAIPDGSSIPLRSTITAPAGASGGDVDTYIVTATNMDASGAGPSASVSNQSTVVSGDITLSKTVAVDYECDSAPDSEFDEIQAIQVAPGQCAIWKIVAQNLGSIDALNVTMTDSITAYTSFVSGSLRYCEGAGCAPIGMSDQAGDDGAENAGEIVTFYVGAGANPSAGEGGTLVVGSEAIGRFTVKVQ